MAFKPKSATATIEAVAELTNLGRQNYQFPGRPFKITQFAFHDKEINYRLMEDNVNIDEYDPDIYTIPIMEPNPDDTDNKYDEDLFPGTLQTDWIDYGYVPYLTGNQLTEEEIQNRLKKFYAKGTVREYSNGQYSTLPDIVLLVQSDISTFDVASSYPFLSSTATFTTNTTGVFDIQGILETASINIIPISPTNRNLVFEPPVYKVQSMAESLEGIEFIATEAVNLTTYQLKGTVYNSDGTLMKGEDISVLLSPYPSVPTVDKSSATFTVASVPAGINYTVNLFSGKHRFYSSGGSLTGYSIPSLSSDWLNLNFTGVPISIYPLKITGQVIDENGNGVGGIQIQNSQNSNVYTTSTTYGQEGQFSVPNLSGDDGYTISVWPEDPAKNWEFKSPSIYSNSSFSADVSNVSFTAVPYVHTISIAGQVTDSGGGVPGVKVTITPAGKITTTDSSGNYLFTNVPKAVDQDVVCDANCYNFTPSVQKVTVATMSAIDDGDLLDNIDFSATSIATDIFGSITYGSNPLTEFNVRKEGIGTLDYTFINLGGDYDIAGNVTNSDYVIIPYSNDAGNEYDFTPMFTELNSYTGSSTGHIFSASAQNLSAVTYTVTGSMVDENGNQLSKTYVKPWVNRKSINNAISINDSQRIQWIDDYTFKLYLQQGNYYISLEGDGYKPINHQAFYSSTLTANSSITLSASLDSQSYVISGYVYEQQYDLSTIPFANHEVSINGRTTRTNANGYYIFTDVINSGCTLPAVVTPLMPNTGVYTYSPTGYSYNAVTLTANKSNVNFTAIPQRNKKMINIDIIRDDGSVVQNPITFIINNQKYEFPGNASGASFLVPTSVATSGFTISHATIHTPNLIESKTVTDDIFFGNDFEKMREQYVNRLPLSMSSFTASTTSVSLSVILKGYSKVSGNVWYSETGTPYNINKQGDLSVHLTDGLRNYYRTVDANGEYEFTKIWALTGTGKQWNAYLDFSNYHTVSSYNGSALAYGYNHNDFYLSTSANDTDVNFLTQQAQAIAISGVVQTVNGAPINNVTLTLKDSSSPVSRSILVGSSVLGSGKYEFLVPTGTTVNSMYVSSSVNNQYQITSFFNDSNSATVYSSSAPLTANTVVNWTYRDPSLQFIFNFGIKDYSLTNNSTQLPVATNTTSSTLGLPTSPISSTGSANNSSLYGQAMYQALINDPTYIKFVNYFDQYLLSAKPPITDHRKMHWTFGGVYVVDPNTGMTINHWNIVNFLTQYYQNRPTVSTTSSSTATLTTTGSNPSQTTGKQLPPTLQLDQADLDMINNGYSYEDIIQILEKHYDLIFFVVDLRNMDVIYQGNYGTQNIPVSSLLNDLNSITNLSNYSVHGNSLKWTVKYFDSASQSTRYATPPGISDSIASQIYSAAPTSPAELDKIKNLFGVDFTIGSISFFNITSKSTAGATTGTGNTNSGSTGQNTPLTVNDFGGYELKEGDINVRIFEVASENPNHLIEIPHINSQEIVCGVRKLPNTGNAHKYVLDGTTHPGLQKGKKYIIAINHTYDSQPAGTLPYNHTQQSIPYNQRVYNSRYWVVYSAWDSGSTNNRVVIENQNYDIRMEETNSITKLDNTDNAPDQEYNIGIYQRAEVAPSRTLVSVNYVSKNNFNACHNNPPTPSSQDYYWIAYFMKFINQSTLSNNGEFISYQDNLRTVLSSVINNGNLTYQEKESAIDSHISKYVDSISNLFVKSIIAYRANLYQKFYQYETALNANQKTYMTSLKFEIVLPSLVSGTDMFNGYVNGQKYAVNPNDGIINLYFNKTNLKTMIKTWLRNSIQPFPLTLNFYSQNPNASDSMTICLDLVGAGAKIINNPPATPPPTEYIWANSNIQKYQFQNSNRVVYIRRIENWYSSSSSNSQQTNQMGTFNNRITRFDILDMSPQDAQNYSQQVTAFLNFPIPTNNPQQNYSNVFRWNNTSATVPVNPRIWIDSVNDMIYMYKYVYSALPVTVAYGTVLFSQGDSTGIDYSFRMGLPNVLRTQFHRTYYNNGLYATYAMESSQNILSGIGVNTATSNRNIVTDIQQYIGGTNQAIPTNITKDRLIGTRLDWDNMQATFIIPIIDDLGSVVGLNIDPNNPNNVDLV